MANREKQMLKTQKTLIKQREEARAAQAHAEAERDRLRGDIEVKAGEHVAVLKREYEALAVDLKKEVAKLQKEKAQLEAGVDAAIQAKADALQKEIDLLVKENTAAAGALFASQTRVADLEADVALFEKQVADQRGQIGVLTQELTTAKMEDNKALRKRLQTKTEKITELEKEGVRLHKLVRALASIPEVKARLKLVEETPADGVVPEGMPVPANATLGCPHGRMPGQPCPHCLGINGASPESLPTPETPSPTP